MNTSPNPSEHQIQNEILRAFATRGDLRLWRSNAGAAVSGRRLIRFGVPGQADLTGILPGGIRLEIEVKTATGRQSGAQRDYQHIIKRFGGVYVLARSVADVESALAPVLAQATTPPPSAHRSAPELLPVRDGVRPP